MAEDPYKVLGVPREAPDEEIRRAYRKLAKQLHPDLNPSSNPAASEERFKKVSSAYEIVGDPVKRKQYDRGEIDANGEQRRGFQRAGAGGGAGGPFGARGGATPPGGDFGFGDIFSDLFGSARGRAEAGSPFGARGRDVRYTLEVDFLEAATGAKKRVTLPDGGTLDLSVPEGVADGQVLRLKGKGSTGPRGTEAGDALVEIKVRAHPTSSAPATTSRSTCPSPSTRPCSAPRSRCRPSRAACSSPSPRAPARAACSASRARACTTPPRGRPATSSSRCASCCPTRSTTSCPISCPSGATRRLLVEKHRYNPRPPAAAFAVLLASWVERIREIGCRGATATLRLWSIFLTHPLPPAACRCRRPSQPAAPAAGPIFHRHHE